MDTGIPQGSPAAPVLLITYLPRIKRGDQMAINLHRRYYELPQYTPILTACHVLGEEKPANITGLVAAPVRKYRLMAAYLRLRVPWLTPSSI